VPFHPRPTSTALLDRLRAGQPSALAELYERSGAQLYDLAHRLTGSADEAGDVLHDLFLGLPEALRKYDERGQLEQWLRRVAARLALTRLRDRHRRSEVELSEALSLQPLSDSHDRLSLDQAIDELPESLRSVLILKVIEGYSHTEIAELLDITRRASEQRLHRALETLRGRLIDSF
jgi:RNA polymerase sigma factor (sigma-70 family)